VQQRSRRGPGHQEVGGEQSLHPRAQGAPRDHAEHAGICRTIAFVACRCALATQANSLRVYRGPRMTDSSADRNPVEVLAEEFLDRQRRGEKPTLREYCERHPELADEIRLVFPALCMVEDLKPETGQVTGEFRRQAAAKLERIGDYRLIREVGRGGMGIVYEAEQESLGRHVALKLLPSSALLDQRQLARFQRESKAAARLHHTNIVPVYGVGTHDGTHYYVMQFIQGLGLDE